MECQNWLRVEDDELGENGEGPSRNHPGPRLPTFFGVYTSDQVEEVFDTKMDHDNSCDRDWTSTMFEESGSFSLPDVMKSPVFSKYESSNNSLWIDLGSSPVGSDHYRGSTKPLPPVWTYGFLVPQVANKLISVNLVELISTFASFDAKAINTQR
ncbi:hypothetical protein L6452_42461 [Arctium lappa]|uniref:Uncharacterized protein n=1 Tax=Arctium lappa TaxID=4217 RepID=A0ACB8XIT7_ARCLA|nr:hypothetical protein L6452_42461 [Arctium lappa]